MERRKFTREFKLEAVRLIKDRGVSYGSHNARVVGCKKLRNAPLDQMDLLDISSLDTKLAEARRGIGDRVRRIAPVEAAEAAPKEITPMPPKIVRERRA